FTALRISATASVIGAIVGELPVGSRFGMGVVIINAAQYYNWRPANLWAAILVSAAIGIVFYHAVAAVERRGVSWSRTVPAGLPPMGPPLIELADGAQTFPRRARAPEAPPALPLTGEGGGLPPVIGASRRRQTPRPRVVGA